MLPELCKDGGSFRAWSHYVHLALQYVEQLRQLVQPVLPQEAANWGQAGVLLLSPYGATAVLRVNPHGSELVNGEQLSTDVLLAPVVLHGVEWFPPIQADPGLGIEDRPPRGHPYQECNK